MKMKRKTENTPLGYLDRVIGSSYARFLAAAIALILVVSFIAPGPRAQLQQSGGSGSNASIGSTGATAPTSAAEAGCVYNSSLPSPSSGQMEPCQLDSSGRLIVAPLTTSSSVDATIIAAVPAGTNLIGYTRPPNACSTTAYESGMVFLPSSSTSVTSTSTCVTALILNNTSSSAQTVSVQDQSTLCNSGVCNILSSFSIPGNSQMTIELYGAKFTSGIKWNAGNANEVMGDIIGNQ
jgi:hypothetical protein